VIVAVGAVLWIFRYSLLYHYYLWRLNHAPEDALVYNADEDLQESLIVNLYGDIELISPHIVPLLIRTYENVNASETSRTAAAVGLISADRNRAEALFRDHKDEEIYAALYSNYLWRLNHTSAGSLILDLHEDIESISPQIVPLLVHTYEDVKASERSRHAAGMALIRADKETAEPLFVSSLQDKDDEMVVSAIILLGIARSERFFNKILEFADHPNERIRWAVTKYLGDIGDAESISVLNEMRANDPDGDVRGSATVQLQCLGVLPRH
jgi:HEAT repeat protein